MADIPGWHQQLQQLQARLEDLAQQQIQTWQMERQAMLDRTEHRFADVGVDIDYAWVGHEPHLEEVRTPKNLQGILQDVARFTEQTKEEREWRDVEQTPEYQAWERERNRPIHEPDADELGWQAEQRFYAEQDPQSEWYRADLYHGEPGPDVAIDLAEAEMRRQAAAQRFAAQELAFDEAQLRLAEGEPLSAADMDHWEHPFAFPTAAEQQAYEDRPYDLMEERAHGIDIEDGEWSARPKDAPEYVEIDTTKPEMEASFQALLDRLDQRLGALVKETEMETQQLQQKPGVRY
jgi:hypothetical protein